MLFLLLDYILVAVHAIVYQIASSNYLQLLFYFLNLRENSS
jgi:hypothetical protein